MTSADHPMDRPDAEFRGPIQLQRIRSFDDVSTSDDQSDASKPPAEIPQKYQQVELEFADDPLFEDVDWWSASTGLLTPGFLLALIASMALPVLQFIAFLTQPMGSIAWAVCGMEMVVMPVVTLWALITTIPMFWHVSLAGRFVAAVLLCIPTGMGFYMTLNISPSVNEYVFLGTMLTAAFLPSALIGMIVQIWSPWSLVHRRKQESPLERTSMKTLIELTTVVAIFLWVLPLI